MIDIILMKIWKRLISFVVDDTKMSGEMPHGKPCFPVGEFDFPFGKKLTMTLCSQP